MSVPAIGTKIWVNIVKPGMVVCTERGQRIEVQKVIENYTTITLDSGWGRAAELDWADQVEVLGYFNPDFDERDL